MEPTTISHVLVVNSLISELMANSPAVVVRILESFSLKKLLKLSLVCKTWKLYADQIISKRKELKSLTLFKPLTSRKQSICEMDEVKQFIEDLWCPTRYVICFAKLSLSQTSRPWHNLTDIHSHLSPGCEIFGFCSSAGIIGTFTDGSIKEIQNPRRDCLSSFFFSKFDDGAGFYPVSLSVNSCEQQIQSQMLKVETLNETFGIPGDKPIRSLIIVASDRVHVEVGSELAKAFWCRENGQLALCGGIAKAVMEGSSNTSSTQEYGLVGLAIAGSNVHACSLLLCSETRSRRRVKDKLSGMKHFLDSLPSCPKRIFAVMFACTARGKNIYKKENVETSIFSELFPHIPICGMFSLGEYGWNYPVVGSQKEDKPPECVHSYTTAICLVAFC